MRIEIPLPIFIFSFLLLFLISLGFAYELRYWSERKPSLFQKLIVLLSLLILMSFVFGFLTESSLHLSITFFIYLMPLLLLLTLLMFLTRHQELRKLRDEVEEYRLKLIAEVKKMEKKKEEGKSGEK